jgi:hypothetical protein
LSLFHAVPQFKMTADIKKPKRTHKLLQVDSETNNLDLDGESIRMYQVESIYRETKEFLVGICLPTISVSNKTAVY